MPINSTISIRQPVGAGAKARNDAADVRAVQSQLNGQMGPSRTALVADGRSGPKTVGMIKDFQRNVCGFRNCDGRVDPGGRTEAALNDAGSSSKWARMSISPEPSPASDSTLAVSAASRFEEHAEKAAKSLGSPSIFEDFRRDFIDNDVPFAKSLFTIFDKQEEVRVFVRCYKEVRSWGTSRAQAADFVRGMVTRFKPRNVKLIVEECAQPVSRLGRLGKSLGPKAGFAATFLTVLETADKTAQGDYHYALVELYKTYIAKRVPWMALVDAVWSIADGIMPATVKRHQAYKIARAVDPIGLQATGVDAVGAVALCAMRSLQDGKLDQATLERLVARMKGGPTAVFADMGEELADAVHELSRMPIEDFEHWALHTTGRSGRWFKANCDEFFDWLVPKLMAAGAVR